MAAEGRFGGKIANPTISFRINELRVKHRGREVPRLLRCGVNDTAMTTVHNRLRGSRGKQASYGVVKPYDPVRQRSASGRNTRRVAWKRSPKRAWPSARMRGACSRR